MNDATDDSAQRDDDDSDDATNLTETVEEIADVPDEGEDEVSVEEILDVVGRRSFGPFLIVAGIVILAPGLGDIPGVPTVMAALVLVVAAQLLFGRDRFWMPRWVLDREISRERLDKMRRWMRKPARFVDKLLRERLTLLTDGPAVYVIAGAGAAIALTMPIMEVIPFATNISGGALVAFGLAMIARDGLFAGLAFALTAATCAVILMNLL